MKDDAITARLREWTVSPPSESARERARFRALAALRAAPDPAAPSSSGAAFPWKWIAAPGLAGLVGFLTIWIVAKPSQPDDTQIASRILDQVERLFPGQVNAVIQRGGTVDVDLADTVVGRGELPVVIEFVRGDSVLRILSYSGRRVCVDLDGKQACFEALVTAEGKVILSGEDFLWMPAEPRPHAGYRVEARTISS